jgi:hypothetical protein
MFMCLIFGGFFSFATYVFSPGCVIVLKLSALLLYWRRFCKLLPTLHSKILPNFQLSMIHKNTVGINIMKPIGARVI